MSIQKVFMSFSNVVHGLSRVVWAVTLVKHVFWVVHYSTHLCINVCTYINHTDHNSGSKWCCIIQTLWWYSVLRYSVLVQVREFQRYIWQQESPSDAATNAEKSKVKQLNVSLESISSLIFSGVNFPEKSKMWLRFLVCSLQLILTARQAHLVNNINLDWFYHITVIFARIYQLLKTLWCSWSGWQCVRASI